MKRRFWLLGILLLLLSACVPTTETDQSPVVENLPELTVNVFDTTTDLKQYFNVVDNEDGVITVTESMMKYGNYDVNTIGDYDITLTVTDSSGNEAEGTMRVHVRDLVAPTITLTGEDTVSIVVGESYNDPGASCVDNYDSSCTVNINDSAVDSTTPGTYTVTYNTTDASGNEAIQLERTVVVTAEQQPVLTLNGTGIIELEVGSSYNEPGAVCSEYAGTTCTVEIDDSLLNTWVVGSYVITYSASDDLGNEAEDITRTIVVVDTTAPVITLNGSDEITIEVGSDYVELGGSCIDNYDDSCALGIDDALVDTTVVGSFIVTYTTTDANQNSASVTRTVHVVDTTAPLLTLIGDNTVYVNQASMYVDLDATCEDNYFASCTVHTDTSSLDMNTPGTYTVTYTATDDLSNTSDPLTRTVIVQPQSDRTFEFTGDDVIYHQVNDAWAYPTFYVPAEGTYSLLRYGSVDETTIGTYDIRYEVTDESGIIKELHLLVHVVDQVPGTQQLISLQNMYNQYMFLYSELIPYDTNRDLYLDTDESQMITSLSVEQHEIDDTFLYHLTSLQSLTLNQTAIYDIEFVTHLPHLTSLDIEGNNLESDDLCALSNHTTLATLSVADNYLADLSCLTGLTNLVSLDLSQNSISSLDSLGTIGTLTSLNISDTYLNDHTELLAFTTLEHLNIDNTDFLVIDWITDFPSLQSVALDEGVTDLYPLYDLDHLTDVTIEGYQADLEYSFLIDYLSIFGVAFHVDSVTPFDEEYPNIILYDNESTITLGDVVDWNLLDYLAYDYYDGYLYENITSSVPDTSTLTAGSYTITLTLTDSDGYFITTDYTLHVLGDYDASNLIVFIRFADETTFEAPYSWTYYEDFFNGPSLSLQDYYLEVSNNEYNIQSVMLSDTVLFYTDTQPRAYYQPYDATSNPLGYQNYDEEYAREQELLANAINWIEANDLVDDNTVLDYNQDGDIDVISFLVSGHVGEWNDLLWPHKYAMYESIDNEGYYLDDAPTINGSYAWYYTFQLIGDQTEPSSYFDLGTFAHEMFHIIGAPDLYHYYSEDDIDATGYWGLMSGVSTIPNHMLQYMKETYGGWDQDEVMVSVDGIYTLNRTTLSTDNVLVIDLGYSNEYLYLEYRQQTGDYESNLVNEGLIVYRVDADYFDEGNVNGYYDEFGIAQEEVFVFRSIGIDETEYTTSGTIVLLDDGDPDSGYLSLAGQTSAGPDTSILLFHSDGTEISILITVVSETDDYVGLLIDFIE